MDYGWLSLIPPLLAIGLAFLTRDAVFSLAAACLAGVLLMGQGLAGFPELLTTALGNREFMWICLVEICIGILVAFYQRSGAIRMFSSRVTRFTTNRKDTQTLGWSLGLFIFFSDYFSPLFVGPVMRDMTDRSRISREKLAYIVDSTAAPVVCIALITTWIGYEVSLIDDALKGIEQLSDVTAYSVFLHSIPYSFYPILAVTFVLIVASTGRDMGPMYAAEVRARAGQVEPISSDEMPALQGDTLEPKPNVPLRAANAFVPIIVLIVGLGVSLYITGKMELVDEIDLTITKIIGASDPFKAMMWASFAGALAAAGMSISQRILSAHETVDAWYGGARATLFGMIVLILAWSMADVTGGLNAKGYLISVLGDSLPIVLVPAIVFVLAAVTAFATGTSWGTMGILMPLVIPLAWAVMSVHDMANPMGMHILYSSVASSLAGAVWGDHCSPISDTTVLSSIASGCDHIEHVRTQMPYAIMVGVVAVLIGTIPGAYGLSPWISIIAGVAVLYGVLRYFGRKAEDSV